MKYHLKNLSIELADLVEDALDNPDYYLEDEERKSAMQEQAPDTVACIYGEKYFQLEDQIYQMVRNYIKNHEDEVNEILG